MPASPERYRDTTTAVVYVRVPGWLKNEITEHAREAGLSINAWAANILMRGLEGEIGLPEPPRAEYPVATPQQVIGDYLRGEDTVEPCGKPAPCERTGTFTVSGFEFCEVCRIRLS